MIQIKKTILTLVALLALTTQAWAQDVITVTWSSGDTYENNNSKDGVTLSGATIYYDGYEWLLAYDESKGTFTTELGNFTKIEITGGYINGFSGEGWSGRTWTGNAAAVPFGGYITDDDGEKPWTITFTIEPASSSSGPEVAWDGDKKTGSFTMPGGNVELEPEYYPQATVADGGVTAADADARATTDDPLVKVDATKLTGAKKLMYFVSNSGTTAPAYDAEGWTDQLPTAEGFTQQGIVYVWYYPVGIDEGVDEATATYSDGDICLQSITARIAAAPTYAVTFAEGTDPNEWTASPAADVKKGQTVTVTYTGSKKVIGVKAEKKAAAPAGPVTYTELKGGEVLHVGDILNFSDANVEYLFDGCTLMQLYCPFTVLRANITGDFFKTIVTPADDGAYYVMQDKDGGYYFKDNSLPATATSDGILITINSEDGNYRYCTASVHEP